MATENLQTQRGGIDLRTQFRTEKKYAECILKLAQTVDCISEKKPERFKKKCKENRGVINLFNYFGGTQDGLERKNPLIVGLGDSVTAGHFEYITDLREYIERERQGLIRENESIEITDSRESYLEKFREKLIDHYELLTPSVINSGIAGDNIKGMQKRLYRDVIRYQPDLVIINASLNWGPECGPKEEYHRVLTEVVAAVKEETCADIILLTSNMSLMPENDPFFNIECILEDRIRIIRELAKTQDVCLADAYKVWEEYAGQRYPVEALLANGINHPSITGHEVFAEVLMKLITD